MDVIQASKKVLDVAWTLADMPLTIRAVALRAKYGNNSKRVKRYDNAYDGETCFVLGGGPSLRRVDLSLLKDKHVISVNALYRLDEFRELKPVFHCAIDGAMYRGEIGEEFIDFICNNPDTGILVSHNASPKIVEQHNVYITPLGYLPSKVFRAFDISLPSNAFINSVCFAIEAALYLGFRRIVLLGCDFTQFTVRHEIHAYDEGRLERNVPLFNDLMGHAIAIMHHEYLLSEAGRRGSEIVNATEGSMLDVYPRTSLMEELEA